MELIGRFRNMVFSVASSLTREHVLPAGFFTRPTSQMIIDAFGLQATSPNAALRQSWRQRRQRLPLVLQSQGRLLYCYSLRTLALSPRLRRHPKEST